MVVSVDDGDGWRRNESLVSLRQSDAVGGGQEPAVHLDDGVTVGGFPDSMGVSLFNVLDDLTDSCLDDVRVSGHQLPLPPGLNGSRWSQATSWQGLEPGCSAPDACLNTTCDAPLSCVSTWGSATCRCGRGQQVVGGVCEDLDECVWQPCLHGGSCYNLHPGFQCVCGPGHAGDHCQWTHPATPGHPLTAPVAIAALTLSLLLLVVVGVVISLRLRQQWSSRAPQEGQNESRGQAEAGEQGRAGGQAEAGEQGREGGQGVTLLKVKDADEERGMTELQESEGHQSLLQGMKLGPPHSHFNNTVTEDNPQTVDAPVGPAVPVGTVVSISSGISLSVVLPASVGTVTGTGVVSPDPLPAKDDLRAYAYEGDGSSAGSLSSALSGLREEQWEKDNINLLVPELLEVVDLLKNLPEAASSSLSSRLREGGERVMKESSARRAALPRCTTNKVPTVETEKTAGARPAVCSPVLKLKPSEGDGTTEC
ncbi:hypothetical protein OTU49_001799 [Cherax quadricarinatus]|uniref:EGF-like domain-containing protein n=6 Tax=Cherax quadricarinatus TaxID=27406 RepID=A0AAW0XS84_CHEQU